MYIARRLGIVVLIIFTTLTKLFAQETQPDSIQSTIVLIGDAGELTNGRHPVVEAVTRNIPLTKKTTVVYLGDNLYKKGLPDDAMPTYDIAKAPLDSQIVVAKNTPSKVYFVPGNHDWANGASIGYESILRVQNYIDILGDNNVKMLPRDGCPGPEEVEITDDITLIMMDSQWWLQLEDKPGVESDCPYKTKEEVLTQLEDILSKNSRKLILFAFHHPFRTYGPHGGYYTIKQHIFPFTDWRPNLYIPLPLIGSGYPITRAVFGTVQDLPHPLYQDMITKVERVVKGHPNVIFMSGHEHTLQLIQDSGYNYIVSGSGCKTNRVSKGKNSTFASQKNGFATLNISKNKNVDLNFYTVEGDSMHKEFSSHILDFSKIKEEKKDTLRQVAYTYRDSVVISASDNYAIKSGFQKLMMGENYRKVWLTPIVMKDFDINTVKGGLTPKSLGGGKQTKSLKLEDKNGKEWTLRTLDKDPEKAVPGALRGTLAQKIVQDMISAGHPYAPLVVAKLAQAVNVPADQPVIYFVPDDPALGIYRNIFANTVNIFEDREPTANKEAKSTDKIVNKMYEDNNHHVDQQKVVTARLLDMLIADWDRHADQWKWGTDDTGKGKLYYPIPRDRDQAFFDSRGLLIKLASKVALPFMKGFNKDIGDIRDLNYVAKDFDRTFMNSIDEPTWQALTDSFINAMTDEVIKTSVNELPPPILEFNGQELIDKLISRRNQLKAKSMEYYRFISKEVDVVGSNQEEFFQVENDKGRPKITVYKKTENADSLGIMFRRTFDPAVTREIRLYGLNQNDKFVVADDVNSKIKLRIIGGKGLDTFDIDGRMNTEIYDLSTEKNDFIGMRDADQNLSADPQILDYRNRGFEYNKFQFPQLNLGYNSEDLFLIGLGFTRTTHAFRKEPYATRQKLTTLFAPFAPSTREKIAYQLKYSGEFNRVIGSSDLVVKGEFINPTLNNFFGFGNSSNFSADSSLSYYRVRNKYVAADLLLRKRPFGEILYVSAGPTYYRYWSNYSDNENRILGKPSALGLDSADIFSLKDYAGLKLNFDVNYIDNENFPRRGITWYTQFQQLKGLNDKSRNLSKVQTDMTIYATVANESRLTTIYRAGGGKIFSKNPEYFQLLTLGANNFLRGYRKNRFSGTGMLYTGLEMRYRLFRSTSYILPGDVGLIGYYDLGRVWLKDENSRKWHSSPGVGFYYAPANLIMFSASMGFSKESSLFNISLGTKFNLNF